MLDKLKKQDIYVLIFTFAIGLFAHSFMIFNKISFFDDLSSIYGFSAYHLFSLGRFTLAVTKIINDILIRPFSSPVIHGILSIFFISLSNILIARLFDIKKTINLVLLSSIIILSTGYICLQAYLSTAVYYTIAIFLSVLSTYLFIKHNFTNSLKKMIITALLQMIVISIYQSYFLFGILIFIIYQICDIFNDNFDIKKSIEYFSYVLLSLILYFIINKLVIFALNTFNVVAPGISSSVSISNYQGISQFLNNFSLPSKPLDSFFSKIFVADSILFEKNYYIFILLYFSVLILYIYIIANRHFCYKKILLLIAYTAILIIASNSLYILNDFGTNLYALPLFPKCLIFLLPLVLLENVNFKINIIVSILLIYYMIYNIVLSNNIYINRYFTLENEKRWCSTLVSRIQSTPGYKDEYDIYIYGIQNGSNITKLDNHYVSNNRFSKTIFPYNIDSINQYNFESFLEYYTGFKAWTFHKNDKSIDISFIDNMPCYPDDDSIRVIDDKIIIKFSDFED